MTAEGHPPPGVHLTARQLLLAGIMAGLMAFGLRVTYARPDELVLDNECAPQGLVARWKARAQGAAFWQSQLAQVDDAIMLPGELASRRTAMAARLEARTTPILARARSATESLYTRHPELALPPPSAAAQLREIADDLEREQATRSIDSLLQERAVDLLLCRPEVADKAGVRI